MWLFLSRRLRAWLLFSIGIPLAAKAVHSAAERARASDPSSRSARALGHADSTVGKLARRRSGKRGARTT